MEEASRISKSADVMMTGPGAERKSSSVTTVQITPIKASPEIKNAIRRQRRMVGIGYAPSGHPAQRVFKPVYRAVLTGGFQPTSTQYTITTSHSLSGNDVTDNPHGGHSRDSGDYELESTTRNSSNLATLANVIYKPGSDIKTLKANNGGYSVVYEKRGKFPGEKIISPRGEADGNSLRSPPASLKVTQATNYYGQFNLMRSVTSELLNERHPSIVSHVKPFLDDSRISTETWHQGNQVFLTQGRRGQIHLTSHGQENGFAEYSRKNNAPAYMQSDFTDVETASTTGIPDAHNVQEKDNVSGEMPCLDFANSIISAVNSDLNQVYQLCHARVKYSDVIEKAQPHRLGDSGSPGGAVQQKLSIVSPKTITNQPSLFPPASAASSSPLTSPRRSQMFPNLPVKPRPMFSNKSPLEIDTSSWSTTYSGQDLKKEYPESSQNLVPEPVVDYDKSDTFVIEFNGNVSPNSKRPILKQTLRMTNTGDTYGKTTAGDINNNSSSTDRLSTVLTGQSGRTGHNGVSTSTFNVLARRKVSDNAGMTASNREKGRLVRFNADPKIHEFTPSEPVVTTKFYPHET